MTEKFSINGDVAVITGAGRGIGEGIAREFAKAGGKIVCAARRTEEIDKVAHDLNKEFGEGTAIAQRTDVTDESQMEALGDAAVKAFGKLDIWVNNAGGSLVSTPLVELPLEEWEKTISTNLTSVWYGVRAAHKRFEENSKLLNISSGAAVAPFPGSAHYGAAKAGVNLMTKTLAMELGPKTRVNALMPGFVPTETVKLALDMEDEDFPALQEQLNLPVGRLGTPEDIGLCALYFCSDASAWVTGQCFAISGTV
jgi:NAD(P)-dependent dehydrogenase (short-subunit alcohol dehydrogenase family)